MFICSVYETYGACLSVCVCVLRFVSFGLTPPALAPYSQINLNRVETLHFHILMGAVVFSGLVFLQLVTESVP